MSHKDASFIDDLEMRIFEKGSTTYYWSSKFFPRAIRDDVFKLYSFVRVADDYVDQVPARPEKLTILRESWQAAVSDMGFDTLPSTTDTLDERVIKNIVYVHQKYDFDPRWVVAFFDSMQMDIEQRRYETLDDVLRYVYGSAEVIGLMMARVMGLPAEAYEAACLQGRAMQWINFLRDIAEDNSLGRCYIPSDDLERFGLTDVSKELAHKNVENFSQLMRFELDRYNQWQSEANKGLVYIPRSLRVPLQTARDMYNWTAQQIAANPVLVFEKKLKPRKRRVVIVAILNAILLKNSCRDRDRVSQTVFVDS